MREQLQCIEYCPGTDEEQVESLWVRSKGQAGMGDTVVGVYYRPPNQDKEVDDALYRQLIATSQLKALVIMGELRRCLLNGLLSQPFTVQEVPPVR